MRCYYCGYSDRLHDPNCPEVVGTQKAKEVYNIGRRDGRRGSDPTSTGPIYSMGYRAGECAAEEAANGYDHTAETAWELTERYSRGQIADLFE